MKAQERMSGTAEYAETGGFRRGSRLVRMVSAPLVPSGCLSASPAFFSVSKLSAFLLLVAFCSLPLTAADRTWTGSAPGDGSWANPLNWGGGVPSDNDALFFAGNRNLQSTNNFLATNTYTGLTFGSNAGAFTLWGGPLRLAGGITNASSQHQFVNLGIEFNDLTAFVTNGLFLVVNGDLASPTGGLTKVGGGILSVYGSNSYPGGTIIREGTLRTGSDDHFGTPGAPMTFDGGTLQTFNVVTLNNRQVNLTPRGGGIGLDPFSPLTITNAITGPGGFTKWGMGPLILSGPATHSGPTTVLQGSMYVDGPMLGTAPVTVNSGAALGGSGTIAGNVTVNNGGLLGRSTNETRGPMTLSLGNLTLNPSSILQLSLNTPGMEGGSNDLLVVNGTLTLDGILRVTGNGLPGVYPIIRYTGALIDRGLQPGPAVDGSLIIDTTNKVISLNTTGFPATPLLPMRVLFVGNSLTGVNNIPGLLQNLASAVGDWFAYDLDLAYGQSLAYHYYTNQVAAPLIDTGNFDIVMLQEYSNWPTIPTNRDNLMYPVVRSYNALAANRAERIMLYETWGYPGGDYWNCSKYDLPPQFFPCSSEGMTIALRWGYAGIANELNAAISPVGLAWLAVQKERPDIQLYSGAPGDYHPGPAGAYLAACVHYASIFGRSPVGNSYTGQVPANIASYLQQVAERIVLQDPWAWDAYGFAPNRFYWAYDWADYAPRIYSRLPGLVVSGGAGLASPSVKVENAVWQTNQVYLGVYDYNYERPGQGRLYIKPGGSLTVTDRLVIGKEGKGWVQQSGGSLDTSGGPLTLAEQPGSSGFYTLAGGAVRANVIQRGQGLASFAFSGGQLQFNQCGSPGSPLSLSQSGGTLAVSNAVSISGDYTLSAGGTLGMLLGSNGASLAVSGTAALGGTLHLDYAPGFTPAAGQTFTLLTAGAAQGKFGKVITPWPLPNGLALVVDYYSNSLQATVVDGHADTDGDGLPDWWELQYFGAVNLSQTWTNSFLNDGIRNGLKYALLIDPTVPVSLGQLPRVGFDKGHLAVTYRQLAGGIGTVGIDYTVNNLTYFVKVADQPIGSTWQSGTNYVEWTGTRIDNQDGSETVTVRVREPLATSPYHYMRLSIRH